MNKCKGGFRVDSSFILPLSSFQEWSRSESNRDLDRARVGSCQLDDGPKSEPDAGFEPATQPWRGRVIKPLHQSGNKKPRNRCGFRGRASSKNVYARLTRSGCPAVVVVVLPA